jgi:hypothetical protein
MTRNVEVAWRMMGIGLIGLIDSIGAMGLIESMEHIGSIHSKMGLHFPRQAG